MTAMTRRLFISTFLALSLCAGCASKPQALLPQPQYERHGWVSAFTSEDWQIVLSKVVSSGGYVHWEILQGSPDTRDALSRYVSLIGRVSPGNRPDLFQTRADRLAYWINAYNAVCMYGALRRGASNPPALYSVDLFSFGGQPMTLDQVETQKIKPLNDPRVAFAINRCTRSSPPLRKEPYDGLTLGAQLVDQGRRFLDDPRGVIVDGSVARVSRILAVDYAQDFLAAYQKKFNKPTSLLRAIEPYAAKHSALSMAKKLVPMAYDASLNRP
jgi:hypothetical protein